MSCLRGLWAILLVCPAGAGPWVAGLLDRIPLSFEPAPPGVGSAPAYIASGGSPAVLIRTDRLEFRSRNSRLRMFATGSSRKAKLEPLEPLVTRSSYYHGSDRSRWRTNVPHYGRVRVASIYPGIDAVYYGNQRRFEYDFVVAPGADPRQIEWRIEGREDPRLTPEGDLVTGDIVHQKPVAYQISAKGRDSVAARYAVHGGHRVRFEIGAYDRRRALYIDPIVSYSSYLTDPADQAVRAVAIDPEGNIVVAGQTRYSIIAANTNADAFVLKLNPTASAILGRIVLGGANTDQAQDVTVDAAGDIYVTGLAFGGFPTTSGAFRTSNAGAGDAFVAKINGRTMTLSYSTFLGGSGGESANAIAVDAQGNAWVSGGTTSDNFPTVNPIQSSRKPGTCGLTLLSFPCNDIFFTKLNAAGSALLFSTYLGTTGVSPPTRGVLYGNDNTYDMAVDAAGNVYATGAADGEDFPVSPGAVNAGPNNLGNVFVVKLTASGSLGFAARIGGALSELGGGIALDSTGSIYVAGITYSDNFPTTPGVVQPSSRGNGEAFALKIDPSGSQLLFSTFLGGSREEISGLGLRTGLAVDGLGNIWVAFGTPSTDFPVTPDATQGTHGGERDAAIVKLSPDVSTLLFSTFLGGSQNDEAGSLILAPNGDVLVVGQTAATNFPTTPNALNRTVSSAGNGYLTRFSETGTPPGPAPGPGPSPGPQPSGSYLVLATGMEWEYRVTFPRNVQLPYQPIHELPSGLICSSATCGLGQWSAGQIQFRITVGEASGSDSFSATITDPGRRFYYSLTDPALRTELRVRTVEGRPQLEMAGLLSIFRLIRPLARPTAAEMSQTQTLTVPAGTYQNVIRTTVTLTGDGQYVDRSTYTTDVFLAPGIGIIKSEMRDSGGRVLYTQELTRTNAAAGPPAPAPPARVSALSAASFTGSPFAPESLVAAFGERLATATASGSLPLPTELEGTTVVIIDASGRDHAAELIFVSPGQVNFIVPASVPVGDATIRVRSGDGRVSEGAVRIELVAPALFSANADGRGVASGYIVRARADGSQSSEFLFRDEGGRRAANPIDLGPETDTVVLVLFGSGIRGRSSLNNVRVEIGSQTVPAQYAGPQGEFSGLDQLNVTLPRTLAGAGEVNVVITVDGRRANVVTMTIAGQPPGAPRLTMVRPPTGVIGGTPAQITFTGSNLTGVTSVVFTPPEAITVTGVQASETSVTAAITVAQGAAPGTRRVFVRAGSVNSDVSLFFAIYDPRTSRVPVISNLAIPSSQGMNNQLDFTITLRIVDNDGDILRGPDSNSRARYRFRFTRGGSTCAWQLTPTATLDRPGQTSIDINARQIVAPIGPPERGSLAVSIFDAAGNESNALTIPDITWACPP